MELCSLYDEPTNLMISVRWAITASAFRFRRTSVRRRAEQAVAAAALRGWSRGGAAAKVELRRLGEGHSRAVRRTCWSVGAALAEGDG